jgi:hypothetical protein
MVDTRTQNIDDTFYTNSFYYKPDKFCPHCGEVIEKGTDLNKYISIKINCVKLAKKQDRLKFNRQNKI